MILNDSNTNPVHRLRGLIPGSLKRQQNSIRMLGEILHDYPALATPAHANILKFLKGEVQREARGPCRSFSVRALANVAPVLAPIRKRPSRLQLSAACWVSH